MCGERVTIDSGFTTDWMKIWRWCKSRSDNSFSFRLSNENEKLFLKTQLNNELVRLVAIPLSGSTSAFITLIVVSFCNWIFNAPSYTFSFNRSTICRIKTNQKLIRSRKYICYWISVRSVSEKYWSSSFFADLAASNETNILQLANSITGICCNGFI